MTWIELKDYLSQITNLHEDALHIYAAMLIQMAAALVLRRSLANPLPWLCVLMAEIINEAFDLAEPGKAIEPWQIAGGTKDLWNTMLLPSLLLLTARFAPSLMVGKRTAKLPADKSNLAAALYPRPL